MPSSMFQLDFDEAATNRGFANIKRAQSIAVSNTLNIQAAITRKGYLKNANESLIMRNTFTKRNIRFDKNQNRVISRMESRAGATEAADYMALQEEGGTRKPKSGSKLAIPQRAARGGSKRRTVTRRLYLKKLKKQSVTGAHRRAGTKSSRTVASAFIAQKTGKVFYHNNNIYQITSFTKSNNRIKFRKKHIYNLTESRTRVTGQPMLKPAALKAGRDGQNIYNSQVRKLLRQKKII